MKSKRIIFEKVMNILDETYEPLEQKHSGSIVDEQGRIYSIVNLHDRSIYRKANVSVYIHSIEKSRHNEPHVHVVIDREFEFVVNIRNISIIREPRKFKPRLERSVLELTTNELQLFRKEWNNSNSLVKFSQNELGDFI